MRESICPCGSNRFKVWKQYAGYRIVRCSHCLLMRTLEFPDDTLAIYQDGYHRGFGGAIPWRDRYEKDLEVSKLRYVMHGFNNFNGRLKSRRFLDVGCANGAFLKIVKDHRHQGFGIELNPEMADFAQTHSGCPVYTDWSPVAGRFDVITYHDVIEHIESPIAEIQKARNYLLAEGILIFDTPDGETLEGRGAHHLKPKEHLYYFTEQTLREMLWRQHLQVFRLERPIPGKIVAYAKRGGR